MRSIPRAGWAAHGFFGFAAKTFGNPSGATSGDGALVPPTPPSGGVNFAPQVSPTVESVFALGTMGGDTILVDGGGGTFLSTDGGVTWQPRAAIAAWNPEQTSGLLVGMAGTWLLSAQQVAGFSFYRSTDNGNTWTGITSGIANGGNLQIGAEGGGGWFAVANVIPDTPANYGLSTNDGVTWASPGATTICAAAPLPRSAVPFEGGNWILFGLNAAGTTGALWVGDLSAVTWVEHDSAISAGYGPALLVGSNWYVGDAQSAQVYSASSAVGIVTAAPVALPIFGAPAFLVKSASRWFAVDGGSDQCSSTDFVNWFSGSMEFSGAGETCAALVYDAVNGVVIAGGSQGSVCTTTS